MTVNNAPYHHPQPWDTPIEPVVLPAMFAASAQRVPHAPLVDFLGRRYNYQQLFAEATAFAHGLRALGVGQGDRVGLFLPNVPIYISAYYGAMMAGAVVVNFSPLYIVDELAHQVEDSGAKTMVTIDSSALLPTALKVLDKSSLDRLVVGRLPTMLSPLKGAAMRLLKRRDLTPIPSRHDVLAWRTVIAAGRGGAASDLPKMAADDLALLQYTGGTTGTPKGAMLTHANLSSNAIQVDAIDPFRGDPDMIMGALPLFHVFANTCVLNRTVLKGGCIAMVPRFDAKQVLATIDRVKPTAFPGVPTMYQALLDHPKAAKTDFSSLKVCISGGAALSAPTRDAFEELSQARLCEGYGLTESSGVVSANPYQGMRKPGTIGQVIPGTHVMLLDKEDPAKRAPEGEPGELVIRGPQVMQGYWNRPDTQAETFAEFEGQSWLRTGDIADLDDDGFLKIVDRSKDMIAVGGFKVFPSQVEAVLVEHKAVKEALVIGFPHDYQGETPRAFVTLNEGFDNSGDDLMSWLNQRVGKHERVSGVTVREDLPKTMIGKLDRKALRAEVLPQDG